jgi:hypothetical protein
MSEAMNDYRELERRLVWMRWAHQGSEAPGEEALLEEMTDVWWLLSVEEQKTIRREGPKSFIAPDDGASSWPGGLARSLHQYRDCDPARDALGRQRFLLEAI